jgi:hypothetical protein
MTMKNKLMLLIIFAGLATAVYRFLPTEMQGQVNTQLHKTAQIKSIIPAIPSANANPPQKKYTLVIPDAKAETQQTETFAVASAYIQHLEKVQVQGEGRLVKVLPDDNDGSKHQRFILRTPEDVTILIAHNIDLAPRIQNLTIGDTISFYGEYVWNEKGGVVHWTHRDPRGHHVSGWLKHNGVIYQ